MLERLELYIRLLEENGHKVQMLKAIEEASEFIQALSKHMVGGSIENVIEEVADLDIMLEQIQWMFAIFEEVEEAKKKKIERQWRRLNGNKETNLQA